MKALLARVRAIFAAGKGRPAAAAILLWMAFASVVSEIEFSESWRESLPGRAIDVVAKPFASGRQFLFDGYQRTFSRRPASQPVTIVAIDEASLKTIGQWPWPRNRLAELIDAIGQARPAAIGLDMYLPEADQTSPERVADNLSAEHPALANELARLPSHDARLATALRAVPSVLGAAGFDFSTFSTSAGLRSVALDVRGGDALPYLKDYPFVLASLPELQAAAQGQGVLTVSRFEGGVVRRVPLVAAINEQPVAGLALEMLRVASGSSAIGLDVDAHGVAAVQVAELRVPTQADGNIWLHFALAKNTAARIVSAADVLAGRIDAERFAGKLVLVGLTGAGLSDMRTTALGELVPGVEIQAQVMESLFDGRFIQRPWWMKWLEMITLLAIGMVMIVFIPRTEGKVAVVLKKTPSISSWIVMGLNALIVSIGYLVFYATGLLFDSATTFIGLSSVLGSLISSAMIEIDRQTKLLEEDRQRLRENEARVAGELAAARRIQLGSLPDPERTFAGETRFSLASWLEPARDVGGDLYDFFMIDARHLCFIVGDVSGKGVPASLFMAIAKTLAKSIALRVADGPAAIVTLANRELARENAEMLFVTLLVGVLDVDSGDLTLTNAGHDAPWRLSAVGSRAPLGGPAPADGPPLCVINDFAYGEQSLRLAPGDTLCLITDGITEAMNSDGQVFGSARLQASLASVPATAAVADVVQRLRDDLAAYVGPAEASDDRTLLVLRWNGPTVNAG